MRRDYLIIGAGPAGLQLGYCLQQAGADFEILESGPTPGTFFRRFPRHRTLISNNKIYNGTEDAELNLRQDWNSLLAEESSPRFTTYTERFFPPAEEMVRYLGDFAAAHQLPVRCQTRVTRIRRDADGWFQLTDERGGQYAARRLVMATGVSRPYLPEIPGIELADHYWDVSVDPKEFTNQRVLILGKANSAFETADNLIPTAAVIHVAGPGSLKLAWRTHFVGHLRAVNNNFLDTYQLKSQNALLDGNVTMIRKEEKGYRVTVSFSRANEVTKDIYYDRVIACTGFRFDASIFDEGCRPEVTIKGRFPAQTHFWESTNVPDLFFAGTVMQVRDFKKSTSGFIHGFRYSVRSLARAVLERYEGKPWPYTVHAAEPEALMEAVLARVNRSSGLWQQFAHLCDWITLENGEARYHEEIPLLDVHRRVGDSSDDYFTVSLEYGPRHDAIDPFDIEIGRITKDDHQRAAEGHYLHPVVRHFRAGELQAAHHVTENLENDWTSPRIHRRPLEAFFEGRLPPRTRPLRSWPARPVEVGATP